LITQTAVKSCVKLQNIKSHQKPPAVIELFLREDRRTDKRRRK